MHPGHRTDEFSRPVNIKGVVRFVTPSEELVDGLATKAFFIGSIACGFAAIGMAVTKRLDERGKSSTAADGAQQA